MKKIKKQAITNETTTNNSKSLKNKLIIPLLLLSLALISSFTMGTVSAQFMSPSPTSSVIYVNGSNGSDDNDGLSWETAKLSIKNATGTVNTNGTINIANGTYTGENNTNITIGRNMNIIGQSQNETIIDGKNINWIFTINPRINVTFLNLTFANGNATYGGAIYNQGNLTINNCTFTGNTASTNGGAIYSNGNCIVNESIFTGNTAINFGGAIENYPGTLTVYGSTFTDNTANSAGGAAIDNWHGTLTVFGSMFTGNNAPNYGAAIYNIDDGNSSISFSWIVNNGRYEIWDATGIVDAENNWWGSNNPDWGSLLFGFNHPDQWVILTVNATPNSINNTQTSTITADFNHINGGSELTGGHIPDGPITLQIPWGSFTNNGITHLITLNTINGIITSIFYANEETLNPLFNPVKVNATADNYTTNGTESAYITIKPAADISINKTFEDTNHNHITSANYQDTIIIHLNVTNNGPDMANWVAITDIIPADIIPVELDDGYLDITSNNPAFGYVYYYGPQWLTIYLADIANGASYDVWIKVTNVGHNNNLITNTANLNTTETYPYDPNPDNDNSTDSFTANAAADVIVKTTSSKTNPKVGETFTLTYKLGNKGPDAAENVTITIPLPEGFVISQITGDGNWTYNSNTNTITWTFTNVPVGDPYLYLSGSFSKAGSYVFGSSISSETYNINTEGVTPITINTVSQVNAASTTTTETIPMQHTGLPFAGLILAILAVLGGSVMPKRK